MEIIVPITLERKEEARFEKYLQDYCFEFKRKQMYYTIQINKPEDAFWIGCNLIALQNKQFDSGITQTL